MIDKAELLAPAGNYDAFLGAVNAGADAVYLGGSRFGARAYADNFDTEQILRALHVAHFYGKKVYLTVNTLLKEREFSDLSDYLSPFYEAGLDGVIIQDFGVFCYIRDHFPGLPLHVSTQMTVTGVHGAALLKEQGACRIVPARELSLAEVKKIKDEAEVEVECFIHGAMCYCYSGQCLFSSILGSRSGNRGRCAQPCRLPYEIFDEKQRPVRNGYPLSLKDMCTLEYLPALLDAGIDSFKIEGRMKRPEYAAGVTAIYRKYIDLYYKAGASGYQVDPADMDRLRGLYIRSEIQTGYYERHNGKEMITLHAPGYGKNEEGLLSQIRETYVKEPPKMPVKLQAVVKVNEPLCLQVISSEDPCLAAKVYCETVQQAKNAPLTEETVRKQLLKTGDSLLSVSDCEIRMAGEGFVPVRALNELRRTALTAFEQAVVRSRSGADNNILHRLSQLTPLKPDNKHIQENASPVTDCLVSTIEQLRVVTAWGNCRRLYVEGDLFLREAETVQLLEGAKTAGTDCFLALPHVLRARDETWLTRLWDAMAKTPPLISGMLVHNLEGLGCVRQLQGEKADLFGALRLIPDAGLYCFNTASMQFLSGFSPEITLPYELNAGEAAHLSRAAREQGMAVNVIVYSHIPMMITANCLRKTADLCPAKGEKQRRIFLKDRYGTTFPVEINCEHCYNVLYNSVPYSLHGAKKERDRLDAAAFRYDFTVESETQCRQILRGDFPFESYTAGHCKRGVE